MKVNIYYGGRGLIDDPTLYAISKITSVLEELRVDVVRYDLYKDKNAIATLPTTLKDADGIILAASVEWFGIGGLMQQFLDMCWQYGDKSKISEIYMLPVVMATTYGEKDAELTIIKAWEMLGGIPFQGLAAYVENHAEFEANVAYGAIMEKKAESFYRAINQRYTNLPTSNSAVKENILKTRTVDLTPQESEQLSKFVSDDGYVKKQKKDIEELAAKFKEMLGTDDKAVDNGIKDEFLDEFMDNYYSEPDFTASYVIIVPDLNKSITIKASPDKVDCYYSDDMEADVVMKCPVKMLRQIIKGSMTFQKGFMAGEITAKGNFKTLRMLDQIFRFRYKK